MVDRPAEGTLVSRAEVEELLYEEAACLDDWRLDDWLALLTDDASYVVPATDAREAGDSARLPLIADDIRLLRERIAQLQGAFTWVEQPRSRTRRLIGNVRIVAIEGDDIHIRANFIIHRMRNDASAVYIGQYENILRRCDGRLKIHGRRSVLDNESLREHGAIAFIL
jgi:p-cumate 2,3-dioxygenase beta subunit